jgi:hypothetical protein
MKASHDSLTGYSLRNWWLYPLLPFARTQTNTIEQQLDAGVRYFDLRFTDYGGKLYAAHGVCVFDITIDEVFARLNKWCNNNETEVYFRVLYEQKCNDMTYLSFKHKVNMKLVYGSKFLNLHCIGQKSKWSRIDYKMNIPFYGDNAYTLANFDTKINEIFFGGKMEEPYVYECYSYKILSPRLGSNLIKKYVPTNSMINFV